MKNSVECNYREKITLLTITHNYIVSTFTLHHYHIFNFQTFFFFFGKTDRLDGIQEDSENIQSYSYGSDNSEEGIYVNMIFSCYSEYSFCPLLSFHEQYKMELFHPEKPQTYIMASSLNITEIIKKSDLNNNFLVFFIFTI